jgi:hypothetical protein
MAEVGAGGLQHHREGLEDPPRLRRDVVAGEMSGCRIEARRAADPDELADLGDMTIGTDRGWRVRWRERFDA